MYMHSDVQLGTRVYLRVYTYEYIPRPQGWLQAIANMQIGKSFMCTVLLGQSQLVCAENTYSIKHPPSLKFEVHGITWIYNFVGPYM